jgi:(1->4)-alpha-D-glucan 1-alpha-D-glucosylmutase
MVTEPARRGGIEVSQDPEHRMTHTAAPRASYRLQLNKDFTFADVEGIAFYLGQLGISHAYLSPILKARAGSTHGYDTVDHSQLNPELGTLENFRRMAGRLKDEGIGIILDIVPNHMGVGGADNPYWLELLEWGRDSRYSDWFDVNWSPSEPSLRNKVLAPFLGCSLGEALETGRLALRFDQKDGSFAAWAEDAHKLPIDPRTYGDILDRGSEALRELGHQFAALPAPDGASRLKQKLRAATVEIETIVASINDTVDDLARLCERQNWRAARYSVAADDINYRRFFIVSDLAAIRVEQQEVFDHAHRLVFQLVEEGLVEGLRIDHIDGLYDPRQYTLRLRKQCPRPIYLVVEKILAPHEQLRADWNVDGTTGYEFANAVAQLLANPEAEQQLTDFYIDFTDQTATLDVIERQAKLDIIDYEMAAELDALTTRLRDIAVTRRMTADLTRNGIRNGLRHLVASMPVYRSYVDGTGANDDDRRNVAVALGKARRMAPTLDPAIFDFLQQVATASPDAVDDCPAVTETAMRLQQFTGPVMAKGLEDTALYRYNRLIALSDVGERPDRFSAGPDSFHDFNCWRSQHAPLGMLTTSSHDTKRGEDVRARVAALTLIADEWVAAVQRWRDQLMAAGAPEIDANELYYLFQQLVGAWPTAFVGREIAPDALEIFRERSVAAMVKAVREARLHSNWSAPDQDYEAAVAAVLAALLDRDGALFADFRHFADRLGPLGARNSLVATTLRLTVPGMPDIYQGAELYEQSMVDPDNRRSVDFVVRQQMLDAASATPMVTLEDWWTGAAKLGTIHRLLQLRRELPELFANGSYEPTRLDSDRALAFLRRHGDEAVLVVAWLGLPDDVVDVRLELPGELDGAPWQPVLGGEPRKGLRDVRSVLGELPVAVLRRVL